MKVGHSALRRQEDRAQIARGDGVTTVQMVLPETGANLINGFTDLPPGTGIPMHFHNCDESVLVVAGTAKVEIDGLTHIARTGDVVWVAAGVRHRFSNPDPDSPLRIFFTYASGDATRTTVSTGEVLRIAP